MNETCNSVYDPTCGSGGMLIESAKYIAKQSNGMIGNFVNCTLKGQEKNLGTWAICKINMIVHNFKDSDIRKGDTLGSPKHIVNGELETFDRVIANPPFSLKSGGKLPKLTCKPTQRVSRSLQNITKWYRTSMVVLNMAYRQEVMEILHFYSTW